MSHRGRPQRGSRHRRHDGRLRRRLHRAVPAVGIGNGAVYKMIPSIFEARSRSLQVSESEREEWSRAMSGALIGFAGDPRTRRRGHQPRAASVISEQRLGDLGVLDLHRVLRVGVRGDVGDVCAAPGFRRYRRTGAAGRLGPGVTSFTSGHGCRATAALPMFGGHLLAS